MSVLFLCPAFIFFRFRY